MKKKAYPEQVRTALHQGDTLNHRRFTGLRETTRARFFTQTQIITAYYVAYACRHGRQ